MQVFLLSVVARLFDRRTLRAYGNQSCSSEGIYDVLLIYN